MARPSNDSLPRLLYLSDVPVEKSYHGSVLLYRLLENYPPDKLRVIEGNIFSSRAERRLPEVAYRTYRQGWARLQFTRFVRLFAAGLMFTGGRRVGRVEKLLAGFEPEAVLTVTYFYSWITAAALAARRKIPLHLIHHDECVETPLLPEWAKPQAHRIFGRIYRQAASRFCVSPYMADCYEQRYGARGDVLYPSRAADARVFAEPPPRLGHDHNGDGLTVAFGGTINSMGQRRQVRLVCDAVGKSGGSIHLFGPFDPAQGLAQGLDGPHVRFRGLLSPEEFKDRLRAEADVLLVPMNFDEREAANSRISFPSKLADYTAVGLPLLIIGPEYCSAVRWARENQGVAEVITNEDPQELFAALERLRLPEHRLRLANTALQKGDEFFAHARAERQFLERLGLQALSPGFQARAGRGELASA
jgi:glycosyltransferase involved in cell wall biosynthesis